MLEKIERVKLSDEILYRLKELIKTGKYGYGDKLPVEKQLAEIFGVSRTTVREALAVLEAEGWVTTKRGNGSYVKRVHNQDPVEPITTLLGGRNTDILELMEIRKVLEREVAMLAALRATPEDLVAINAAYQAMVDAISQRQDTADTDYAIHYAIAKAAKNNTILTIISSLRDLYDKVIKTNRGHWAKPLSYELILSEHKAIIQAIEKRQGTAARKAMDNHLERAHRISEEVLLNISGSKGDK